MKFYLFILISFLFFLLQSCKKNSSSYFNTRQSNQSIAFQPLDDYAAEDLVAISKEIGNFYHKKVIILKPLTLPKTYFKASVNAWSADSIIMLLSNLQNDSIAEIIGLTHHSIYTLKQFRELTFYADAIFGMGYWPGNSCVVSDVRLSTTDTAILNHRMRNVIIHEVGHNAGLDHCTNNKCIMSKKNGTIAILDNGPNDYCNRCKNELLR